MYDNQSLRRAFELLEVLCDHPGGISVPELVEHTGLHRATVHRLLEVMRTMGYVAKTEPHKRYIIGFRMARFGNKDLIADRIRHRAARRLRLLSSEFAAVVVLGMLRGMEAVVVEEFRPRAAHLPPPTPRAAPALDSAIGRALLAFQSPAWIERTFAASTALRDAGPAGAQAIARDLRRIRRERLSWVAAPGVAVSLAAPLVNPAGRATCAIALSWHPDRLDARIRGLAQRRLHEVAAAIVADLRDQAVPVTPPAPAGVSPPETPRED
jgi:DNA-binding IclR family transcriptional regulator